MRQLNNVELNEVNGAWGIPESIAAYLPTSMPSLSMPAFEIPALAYAHPYAAVAVTVGTLAAATYLGYRWMK